MIKKLFLAPLFFLSFHLAVSQNAIQSTTAPASASTNEMITVSFDYTADMMGTYQIELWKTEDGTSPDFAGNVGGAVPNTFQSGNIAVAASSTTVNVPVTIPSGLTPTSDFVAPEGYLWFIKITVNGNDIFPPSYPVTEITVGPEIQSTTSPAAAEVGEMISVSFDYTTDMVGTYQIELWKTEDGINPDFANNVGGAIANTFQSDNIAITSTSTTVNVPVTIPTGIADSSTFTAPEGYIWFIKITVDGIDYFPPSYPTIVINDPALGVDEFTSFDTNVVHYNQVSQSLEIDPTQLNTDTIKIFNVMGKKVTEVTDINNKKSVDLSYLSRGLYIARTSSKFLKFVR